MRWRRNSALEAAHFDNAPYTKVCGTPGPPFTAFLFLADSHSNAQTSHYDTADAALICSPPMGKAD